jgi:IclR family acetate operon transcriptional repressor
VVASLVMRALEVPRSGSSTERPHADERLQSGDKAAGSRAIHRALAIVECFGSGVRELGINELAKTLALSPSTVHRLVRALVARGYLAQNEGSNRYVLGPTMIVLGQVTQRLFGFDKMMPVLEEVARRYGEGATLGMRDGASIVVLAQIESTKQLRSSHAPGTRLSLHASSLGKAVLFGSRDVAAELRGLGKLSPVTPRTVLRKSELAAQLALCARRGFAIDDEESVIGVRGVAAPVTVRSGIVVAALGIEAPTAHLPDAWAQQIGKELGAWAGRIASVVSL